MRINFVYYFIKEQSASVKNVIKTCEHLGKKADVTLTIPFKNINKLLTLYGAEKNFKVIGIDALKPESAPLEFLDRFYFNLATLLHIRKNDYDVIYTRDISFLLFLKIFNVKLKCPVIYESHRSYKDSKKVLGLERHALKIPKKIIANSMGTKSSLVDYGVNPQSITVQENCVDLSDFNAEINIKEEKNELGVGEEFIITYLGSFEVRKGIDILLEAAKILSNEISAKILLLGGVKREKEIISKINHMGLKENVIYLGFVDQDTITKCLKLSDLAVLPSIRTGIQETFTCPMKLMEYMASRTPVVASDLPTVQWIVDSRMLYLAEPGNPVELANKILDALKNKNDAKKKANFAFEVVKRKYTWDKKADKILKAVNSSI